MKREVIITNDGSSSIFIPELDETYHSSHGAIQEAKHVFIENGIKRIDLNQFTIFEMGFGTGLNAVLTSMFALQNKKNVKYIGLEAFPVSTEMINSLNYVEELGQGIENEFESIHNASWEDSVVINPCFELNKIELKIQDYTFDSESIDLVYYDAFGPRVQSELWSETVLKKVYDGMKQGAVFVTYCAQGQFKRNLKAVGFKVEGLPGPPGKREMTLATKL